MKKIIKTLGLAVILMVGVLNSNAITNDVSMESANSFLSLSRLKFSLQEEFRFRDTEDAFYYQFTDIQVKYDIGKYFDIFTDYRLIFKQKNDEWEQYNVIMPGFTLKHSTKKRGKAEIRFRGEAELDTTPIDWALNIQPKYNFPWKFTKYDINPFIADEMFFDIKNDMTFTVNRIRVGVDWNFTKKIRGQAGYYYETYPRRSGNANVIFTSIKFEF